MLGLMIEAIYACLLTNIDSKYSAQPSKIFNLYLSVWMYVKGWTHGTERREKGRESVSRARFYR